jgi:hypothetical protein
MHEQPLGVDLPLEPNDIREPIEVRGRNDNREPSDYGDPFRWRRVLWPAVGVTMLAATAFIVGQLQRSTPEPPQPLETVVVPGNGLSTQAEGNLVLVAVEIKNIGHNPVTVTNPQAEPAAGVTVLDARVGFLNETLPMASTSSPPSPLLINPMVGASVIVRFTVDCGHADPQLPIFRAILVTVSAGTRTAVDDVTPDDTMMADLDAAHLCH